VDGFQEYRKKGDPAVDIEKRFQAAKEMDLVIFFDQEKQICFVKMRA
jgi:hypothetical protein